MIYRLFDIKASGGAIIIEIMSNKELEEELRKPIIRKLEKKEVPSLFIDNIWGAGLTDMQLISKSYKRFLFLLCVIDIYSKYAQVIPLKGKKGASITNTFKIFQMNLVEHQIQYGSTKTVNFTLDQ